MIKAAALAGVDAIKLQTYTADSMTLNIDSDNFRIMEKDSLWYGRHLHELYSKASTPYEWHQPLFDYAKSLGVGNVYTPQIVVNGSAHSNRFTRSQIMAASLPDNRPVFDLTTADSALYVKSSGETDMAGSNLTVIAYKPGLQKTPVSRGENRRRTLENYNVVTGVYPVNAETSYRLDLTGHEAGLAYALLASDPVTSEVLSITQIRPE